MIAPVRGRAVDQRLPLPRLQTLWELMRRFDPNLIIWLARLEGSLGQKLRGTQQAADVPMRDNMRRLVRNLVEVYGRDIAPLGFLASTATVARLRSANEKPGTTYGEAWKILEDLRRRVVDELGGIRLFALDPAKARFYVEHDLFGPDVAGAFPSASFDIEEAGRCLALDRPTAAVLHLMRALEVGLQALAARFKTPYAHASWNTAIEKIQKEIGRIERLKRKPTNWQSDRQFYAEAGADFRLFKDAWRNYVMHIHETYVPEKAEIIFDGVCAFMQHLATRLREPV